MQQIAKPSSAASGASRPRPRPKFAVGATALYAQLASVLRGRILSSEWPPDTDIPSIDELCAQYGLGRITVRQALQVLAGEGLISSQRGRRTFVTYASDRQGAEPLFPPLADMKTQAPEYSIRVISRLRAAELPAGRWVFGESVGPYIYLRKIDHSRQLPYAVSGIYVAEDVCKRFPKGAEQHSKLLHLVVKYSKLPVTQARERVRVAAADYEEADALGCDMVTPVARVERVFCDKSGRVVYYGNTTYHGSHYGMERDLSSHLR